MSATDFADLHFSGSAEFTPTSFARIIQDAAKPVVVFDLRQESHGFIDGHAVTWQAVHDWSNIGKSSEAVIGDERRKLEDLKALERVSVFTSEYAPHPEVPHLQCRDLMTEHELVEREGPHRARYVRVAVTDHTRPSDAVTDHFLLLLRSLAASHHCHFHCRAGKGRTTMFMSMYDMMHNAHRLPLETILARQNKMVGDYDVLLLPEEGSWKYDVSRERMAFIMAFYQYAREHPLHRHHAHHHHHHAHHHPAHPQLSTESAATQTEQQQQQQPSTPPPLWSEWLNKQKPSSTRAIKLLSLWTRAAKRIQQLFRRRRERRLAAAAPASPAPAV